VATPDITFRPFTRVDFPLFAHWLLKPHVAKWYRDPEDRDVEAVYGPTIDGTDPTDVFIVELDRRPIGLIQRYRLRDNPEWEETLALHLDIPLASIDYLIGDPTLVGKGLGSAVIRAFCPLLFARYPEVEGIAVGLQQENVASWRCLEKAGFTRVREGVLESDDPSDSGPAYVYLLKRP